MSSSEKTVEEMSKSLTGFDEIAIAQHMGVNPYTEHEDKPHVVLRALIFIDKKRQGLKDAEAKSAALNVPFGEITEYFAVDDEIDPDNPETPAGKGD